MGARSGGETEQQNVIMHKVYCDMPFCLYLDFNFAWNGKTQIQFGKYRKKQKMGV